MKKAMKYLGVAVATLFTLSSCTGSNETAPDVDGASDYVMSESFDTLSVAGMVVDPSGAPLADVLVVTGTDSVFTGTNGQYTLEKKRCVNGRSVVKFEKGGYFSVVRTAEGDRLDAVLQPMEEKDSVAMVTRFKSTEATTLKVGGMSITIPANSLTDEKGGAYSGHVSASVFYLDPNSKDFNDAMPGSDMSGVTENGKEVTLLSYGMVEVSLFDSTGGKLQLKKDAESELSFPIPAGFDDKLHKSIPLWYFDESKGTWIEEGVAEKVEKCYKGKVKHFSWHNLDYPELRAYIEGYVRNKKGEPLQNVRVTVSQTSDYTNADGFYHVVVPKNTPVFVTVRPVDYGGKVNLPIYQVGGLKAKTVYHQDIVLPNAAIIKGRVTNTDGLGVRTMVSALPRSRALTNYSGEYTIYLSDDEPVTVTVLSEDYLDQKNVDLKIKPYAIAGENDVKSDFSYDFVLPTRHYSSGHVVDEAFRSISGVKVTAVIDGKTFTDKTSSWGHYSFYYLDANKATVGVKSADYYGYTEKFYDVPCKKGKFSLPTIVMPIGQIIKGRVVNSCGPSTSKVTLVYGGLLKKKREIYTINTDAFGDFRLRVPFNKKKESKQVRIKCRNKQKKIKIKDTENKIIDLGDIEICSDFKTEENCVYVETDDKILKFDLKKDRYNEMMKSEEDVSYRRLWANSEKGIVKRQIWCKNSDYAGFLVLNVEGEYHIKGNTDNRVKTNDTTYTTTSFSVYLVTPSLTTYEGKWGTRYMEDDLYMLDFDIYDQKGNDAYVFGKVNPELILPERYLDKSYKQTFRSSLTYGNSPSQKFFTCNLPKGSAKEFEVELKKQKNMVEKGTFRDANDNLVTVYANDNEQALIRRMANSKWEATILLRDGIGNDPLYQCWKVDFSHSSLRTKGTAPVEYMMRNEADIINMVMFGPLMGIKFEKTNISDNKCGCSNQTGVVPAN